MGSMSDKDQKTIFVLLTLMVILLPYFFFIKDKKIEIASVKAENVSLQERLDYLRELDTHRDEYIKETEEMNASRDAIIASFPADIDQANYTMFLLNTEYSSDIKEIDGKLKLEYPILFDSVSYGTNVASDISSESADTGFVALTNQSALTYRAYYDGVKYLLQYLMDYKDPMAYSQFTISFAPETGVCNGNIILNQYAVSGTDRVFTDKFDILPDLDKEEMRGNEEVGIFGPVYSNGDDEEAEDAVEEAATEDADEDSAE